MTRTALAIRHVAFEDLGVLAPVLRAEGYEIEYLDSGRDELTDERMDAADLVVVLGGPVGANDGDRYPVVDHTIELLRARLADDLPTLGICLGAQLIARALGADVAAGSGTEIGYAPVEITKDDSPLRGIGETHVLHWHNDRFDLPDGAVRLASTEACDNQAFSRGPNVLALQFHLEVPRADIERWLIGHAGALAAAGIDPRDIREQSLVHGRRMESAASQVFQTWIRALSLLRSPVG